MIPADVPLNPTEMPASADGDSARSSDCGLLISGNSYSIDRL